MNHVNGWTTKPSPKETGTGSGWFAEIDTVLVDKARMYVVMVREVTTDIGVVKHACMRSAFDEDIPWREKQRIKNEIFGEEAAAVEVFPKESQLVDEANMYHLWILPDSFPLPFGIHASQTN